MKTLKDLKTFIQKERMRVSDIKGDYASGYDHAMGVILGEIGNKLENCPFCGGGALIKNEALFYYIECTDCKARTGNYEKVSLAILNWDKRKTGNPKD